MKSAGPGGVHLNCERFLEDNVKIRRFVELFREYEHIFYMNVYCHRELLTAPTWISFMMMLTNILMKLPSFTATPKDQNSNQILKYAWYLDHKNGQLIFLSLRHLKS